MNEFLSNAVKNLKFPRFCTQNLLVDHISHPTLFYLFQFILFHVDFVIVQWHPCTSKQKCKKYSTLISINRYIVVKSTERLKSLNYPVGIYLFKVNTKNAISGIIVLNVSWSMFAGWNKNKKLTHKKPLYIYDNWQRNPTPL